MNELKRLATEKSIIKNRMIHISKNVRTRLTESESKNIMSEANQLKEMLEKNKRMTTSLQESIHSMFPHTKDITQLQQFKDFLRETSTSRSRMAANDWCIETLEKWLHYKTIVFHQDIFENDKKGEFVISISENQSHIHSSPETYVLLVYTTKHHYEVLRYMGRSSLTFKELPYAIKARLATRSIENPHSVINRIDDFVKWKSHNGIETEQEDADPQQTTDSTLFPVTDLETVFIVYNYAPCCNRVLDLEKIQSKRRVQFSSHLKQLPANWRQKLADDYMGAIFHLDNQVWNSVTHYLQALPYKESNPDFYQQFTRGNKLSKNAAAKEYAKIAKIAGSSKSGVYKKNKKEVVLRPTTIPCRELTEKDRLAARNAALRAKVMQNEDIKRILLATDDATLMTFESGKKMMPDHDLMQIRSELQGQRLFD